MSKDQTQQLCNHYVNWWDGEYEGTCELPIEHAGPHYDGLSCFTDHGEEVELKSLPPRPLTCRVTYKKNGSPIFFQTASVQNGFSGLSITPEPGIEIVAELSI